MLTTKLYGTAGVAVAAATTSWIDTALPYAQFAATIIAAVAGLVSLYIAVQKYRNGK